MPETLTTTRGCQHVLRDNEAGAHSRIYCEAPARWLCVDNRQRYCDEHAHDVLTEGHEASACCQPVEIGAAA